MSRYDRTLNYWSSFKRQRAWIKAIPYTILTIVLLFTIWWLWRLEPVKKIYTLYTQKTCSAYTLPENTVIYTEESDIASTLLLDKEHYSAMPAIREAPTTRALRRLPECWPTFDRRIPKTVMPPMSSLGGVMVPYTEPDLDCILFMHDRCSPSGQTRLVVVGLNLKDKDDPDPTPVTRMAVVVKVFDKETWKREAWRESIGSYGQDEFDLAALTFYAGECDPLDASKFTIRWDLNGVAHSIKGSLDDPEDPTDEYSSRAPSVQLEGLP